MRLKDLAISAGQFDDLHSLQEEPHKDSWHAAFSVNRNEEVRPFVCYGETPEEEKKYVVLRDHPLLSDVAGNYLQNVDERGGRFFINRLGVYAIKGEDERPGIKPEQFIRWMADETLVERRLQRTPLGADQNSAARPKEITFQELRAMQQWPPIDRRDP